MLLGLRPEPQSVDDLDSFPQVVAALELVLHLAEDLPDLVLDRVGRLGALLEAAQVREKLAVDEAAQIVAGHGRVVVQCAVGGLRRRPRLPAIRLVQDECVLAPLERGLVRLVLLDCVQVLQEQQP